MKRREKLERVLTNDPGMGVMRHADAGYEIAIDHARATGIEPADGGRIDLAPSPLPRGEREPEGSS